ncbi:MAG: hypothetical protein Q8M93_06740 [Polaromonas sp.]|uniref:hypothetical protein n=1 Tax=Polaromonas sp. TaxID=1869339 RepID=UPI0027322A90|nr:hypothetical protein [Polaromonas sp.]MDP2451084.1 hypothetical protein [Polaromonas sp.]MDP3246646.1 hypothetical protein [Polaromonas sp.]MDP3825014.1 hypothetical protein [Polaromonas sp.]
MESSLNVEDHGDWLSFGMSHAGGVVPVKISRAAMEEHFDATQGPDSLKKAYALDAEMIHARAADHIVAGVSYSPNHPLVLGTEHF